MEGVTEERMTRGREGESNRGEGDLGSDGGVTKERVAEGVNEKVTQRRVFSGVKGDVATDQ